METYMTYKRTGPFTGYEEVFDEAACDTSSPWLPPPPVRDTEASETRGDIGLRVAGPGDGVGVEDTLTARGKSYGDFRDNARIAQNIKLAMQSSPVWIRGGVSYDMMEALDLIASKIGRMLSGDPNYIDNWHDIAGYATLIERRLKA